MKSLIVTILLILMLFVCAKTDNVNLIKSANSVVIEQKPIIIIDAGHGGFDGGAVKGDILEKDINLNFALELEPLIKAFGFETIMTRTYDTGTEDNGLSTIRQKKVSDIKNRLSLIENTDVVLFLSLHQNMFSQSKYSGTQVFYGAKNEKSEVFGKQIQTAVQSLLQTNNTRLTKPCGKNIYLMFHNTKPSVLVECGFMSNQDELNNLLDKEYRNKLNFCILHGILKGRNLT